MSRMTPIAGFNGRWVRPESLRTVAPTAMSAALRSTQSSNNGGLGAFEHWVGIASERLKNNGTQNCCYRNPSMFTIAMAWACHSFRTA